MPASRPNLAEDVRAELLDRFLRDYEDDRRDGKTVRALHSSLEKHVEEDDKRFDKLLTQVARAEGRYEAEATTGRFPQLAPVEINVEAPKSKSFPWLQKVIAKPLTILLIGLATIVAHALVAKYAIQVVTTTSSKTER